MYRSLEKNLYPFIISQLNQFFFKSSQILTVSVKTILKFYVQMPLFSSGWNINTLKEKKTFNIEFWIVSEQLEII